MPKTVVPVASTTVATVLTTTQIPQTPTTVSSTVSITTTVLTTTPPSTTPIPTVTLPLLCVTGNTSVGARVPDDGICTYLVFDRVRAKNQTYAKGLLAGDTIMQGNKIMRRFMDAVSGLKKTVPMLAMNLHYWDETIKVLKHSDVLGPYIREGIKGIGIPNYKEELDVYKAGSILELKLSILRNLLQSQKHNGVILFAGLLLTTASHPDAVARIVKHSISLLRHVSLYIVFAHSPRQDAYGSGCVRRPMSSFRTSTLGDHSLQSVTDAIDIVKGLGARNATYFLSLTMGIHRFLPQRGWVEDMNKLESTGCTMHFDSYEKVCKNPMVEGSVAEYKDDAIHYDYDKKARIWRTYDTLDTIRKKIKRAYKELAGLPFGWAAFYIEMDDWNGACPNSTKNKPQRLLELIKPLKKQLPSG
ncbi:uncharacterized protein LOC8034020 isoform X1 [Ixodes scapularis]|uniref:uncharacterized protein LOC8034020 isoform X1 n=1 Tax=Ixodes scapularis TaxID=6945 RepID=UPI001C38142F|nr:uncharacterized protein LOC8034020 isoform X1 [Ixodes scapularis]